MPFRLNKFPLSWGDLPWSFARFGRDRGGAADVHAPLLSERELGEIAALASETSAGRRMSEHLQRGEQASRFRGAGIDFEDLRPYQPGDDPRRIDWRVTARLRKTFVRVYGETRQAALWVVADRGASMCFGTHTRLKAAQAARLAALLLSSASRGHEALALSLLDHAEHLSHPPSAGRAALQRALHDLSAPCPPRADNAASLWTPLLSELEISLPQGSRLWLCSDFLGLSQADERLLQRLAARADVRLALIEDVQEDALPRLGRIRLAGKEGEIEIDTQDPALRQTYAQFNAERRQGLEDLALRLGGHLLRLRADEDLAQLATRLAGIA